MQETVARQSETVPIVLPKNYDGPRPIILDFLEKPSIPKPRNAKLADAGWVTAIRTTGGNDQLDFDED